MMQRFLTFGEQADLLFRHPILALRVAATKAALTVLNYEQLIEPPAWYEFDIDLGLIDHDGDTVYDPVYGDVVIFPAVNGEIYFIGWVERVPADIHKPEPDLRPWEPPVFGDVVLPIGIAAAFLAVVVYAKR